MFSNSATTNSSLSAKLIIDPNGLYIMLWEYGNHQVKGYTAIGYKIILQDTDGKKTNITGLMKKLMFTLKKNQIMDTRLPIFLK